MKTFLLLLPLTVLLLSLSACGQKPPGTPSEPPKPLTKGQEIFLNDCMGCHTGSGNPPEPNGAIMQSRKLASLESFKAFVRNPDNGMMPAFPESSLDDASLAELYQYLHEVQAQQTNRLE